MEKIFIEERNFTGQAEAAGDPKKGRIQLQLRGLVMLVWNVFIFMCGMAAFVMNMDETPLMGKIFIAASVIGMICGFWLIFIQRQFRAAIVIYIVLNCVPVFLLTAGAMVGMGMFSSITASTSLGGFVFLVEWAAGAIGSIASVLATIIMAAAYPVYQVYTVRLAFCNINTEAFQRMLKMKRNDRYEQI